MAVTCSESDPFFRVRICAPVVVPVSPSTWMLTPDCEATEEKWTPWLPTALRTAWYSDWALGVPAAPAVPGTGGEHGQCGQCGAARGQGRGVASDDGAHGAHEHSPGWDLPCGAGRPLGRWGTGTSSHAPACRRRRGTRTPRHTELTGPMETVAWGACGRTISPHFEYVTCSAVVRCPLASSESSSTGTCVPWART